jgi:hypothetical protein
MNNAPTFPAPSDPFALRVRRDNAPLILWTADCFELDAADWDDVTVPAAYVIAQVSA